MHGSINGKLVWNERVNESLENRICEYEPIDNLDVDADHMYDGISPGHPHYLTVMKSKPPYGNFQASVSLAKD